jgi:hypothetical protein
VSLLPTNLSLPSSGCGPVVWWGGSGSIGGSSSAGGDGGGFGDVRHSFGSARGFAAVADKWRSHLRSFGYLATVARAVRVAVTAERAAARAAASAVVVRHDRGRVDCRPRPRGSQGRVWAATGMRVCACARKAIRTTLLTRLIAFYARGTIRHGVSRRGLASLREHLFLGLPTWATAVGRSVVTSRAPGEASPGFLSREPRKASGAAYGV